MKKLYFYIALIIMIVACPQVTNGQVAPEAINQALLAESIESVLGTKQPVEWMKIPITQKTKQSLKGKLKIKSAWPDTLHLGKVTTDKGTQYLIPDIAPSKAEKFSYVLYLNKNKEIIDVDVVEYRENYGYEIDYAFFRKQFQDKEKPEKLQFGRTIQNISGATISARSLTYSVRDLLALMQNIELK